jgi:ABC-type phosphate transport system substrate-binding protein
MKALLCILAAFAVGAAARGQDVAFIVHPAVKEAELSAAEVKGILLGTKTNWSSGPLKLAVQGRGALHDLVIQRFTQRSSDQFEKYWKKQVFSGKGTLPTVAASDGEMIAFVAGNPGAFGYVDAGSVTAAVKRVEVK